VPDYPVLYSFRRCPYAIRARMAIRYAGVKVEIREVLLADKPSEMVAASPKGTVPVVVLDKAKVMDESLDIMLWALAQNDPEHWLLDDDFSRKKSKELIDINDGTFKQHLDHYKYADRFPEQSMQTYRQLAEEFLQLLDDKLQQSTYLLSDKISITDIAIFPFIRQCASVDKQWFDKSQYFKLQQWLNRILESTLFIEVMEKYPRWPSGLKVQIF